MDILYFCLGLLFILVLEISARSAICESVKYLPGFEGPLPFQFETGYIGVDESEVELFYYFVKSENNPKNDPLILWLTGGPGCSSFQGLMYENGPLYFKSVKYNGSLPTLLLNPNSWTKFANIIYLDLPVNTGFSYATPPRDAAHSNDTQACHQAYKFLQTWLIRHPEFISNPFYMGGDSYVGLILPSITQMISYGNEVQTNQYINLQGYILGNPITIHSEDQNYRIPFVHQMGLISDELYQYIVTCEELQW
jgi:serine carboxypeptidase-like clade 1